MHFTPIGTVLGHHESVFSIYEQSKHVYALHDAHVHTKRVWTLDYVFTSHACKNIRSIMPRHGC
jgi:hypothetical protein